MGQTGGQQIGGEVAAVNAQHQQDLFNLGLPGIQMALGDYIKDLGAPGSEPASVKSVFDQLRGQTESTFQGAEAATLQTIAQQMKQSGYRGAAGAEGSAAENTLAQLESQRLGTLRSLTQQESDAAMQQRNFEISQILGIGSGAISSSFGGTQNLLNLANMNQSNPWGSALGGAASGAAAGSAGGWVGALAGGLVGGVSGYFSGGG